MEMIKLNNNYISKASFMFFKGILKQMNYLMLVFKDRSFIIKFDIQYSTLFNQFCDLYNFDINQLLIIDNLAVTVIKSNTDTYFEEVYLE